MSTARACAALVFALALSACGDPGIHVRGQVKTAPDPCRKAQGEVYASTGPIVGAAVRLRCPERPIADLATTDATGQFEYMSLGLMDMKCAVLVEKEGYQPQAFALEDICVLHPFSDTLCSRVSIQAELAPTP